MALTTYAQLQNAVLSFTHRSAITDAVSADMIPDLIRLGELWIFRKAQTREMETALSVTLSSGIGTIPTDYTGLKHARIDGSPTRYLRQMPSAWIYENYPLRSSDTKPSYIAVDGSQFIFGPFPDSDYTVKGIYYAKPTTIASSANALFLANPDLYIYAAICAAEPYLKNDKRLPMWMAMRNQIMDDVNEETDEDEYGGGSLEVRPA